MKIIILFLLLLPSFLFAESINNLDCIKNYNNITSESDIKNSSPEVVKVMIQNDVLKSFIWDSQELNVHFELKSIKKIDFQIGSKGYSDIKNAVFFEVKGNEGYLYQYNKKGVSYICSKD